MPSANLSRSRKLFDQIQLLANVRANGGFSLSLVCFFQLARELFHALPHDFTRLELYRRTRRNDETATRLVRVPSNPWPGKARQKHAEVP